MSSPRITGFAVYPVAGRDSMLLNLSGAHAPYFTRNVLLLEDSAGNIGLGAVPGGEQITTTLRECEPLVMGARVGNHRAVLGRVRAAFDHRDMGGGRAAGRRPAAGGGADAGATCSTSVTATAPISTTSDRRAPRSTGTGYATSLR